MRLPTDHENKLSQARFSVLPQLWDQDFAILRWSYLQLIIYARDAYKYKQKVNCIIIDIKNYS